VASRPPFMARRAAGTYKEVEDVEVVKDGGG
jgi:hypothetical protein